MSEKLEIRESIPSDLDAIESLYPEAFPGENLLPLVRDLLEDAAVTTSLVGAIDSRIVGHAIFTKCLVAEVTSTLRYSGRWSSHPRGKDAASAARSCVPA